MSHPRRDTGQEKETRYLSRIAGLISLFALAATIWQGFLMRSSMRLDERAWISVPAQSIFPLNGTSVPAAIQIQNTGKTPATAVEGDYVATVLTKGQAPSIGDFSTGHPHNRLYTGAVFPNSPISANLPLVNYGPYSSTPIVADEALRQDIANGNRYIIFYGKISYRDVFGAEHWTQFCTGSGSAIGDLKPCITYNDVDHN